MQQQDTRARGPARGMETAAEVGARRGFGTLLRRYRLAAGITQEELAERAHVSRRSITEIERGTVHTPRRDTLELLAGALAMTADERAGFLEAGRHRGAGSPSRQMDLSETGTAAPFVGRAGELALLERHLTGEGTPLLLLAGEPGIGKSRLLQAAIPRAAGAGLRVLQGGCQQRGGQEIYAPFPTVFQRHLQSQRAGQVREDLRGCAWLVRLLPELTGSSIEPLPTTVIPPEHERRLVFAAVMRFLTNVAGPAGTLLVLDDLQWAGADALDLLAMLVRAAADAHLCIIGAYRDTEVTPEAPLAATLADLTRTRLVTRRLLNPLSPQEAAQLLDELLAGDMAGPALRTQVLQRAGGVPFFLVSCAQGLRQDIEDGSHDSVPWDVAQSVRQRITALPEAARRVLGIAAVIGRTARYRLLQAVAARPEQEVLDALEVACHAALLAEEGAALYRFTHDVVREVAEADLSATRRMLLHRDIAQELQAQGGQPPVEELAYHYARSDQPEQALPFLIQAAERAGIAAAHQEEAALLAQAIVLAQQANRADLLGDLHARRGTALFHLTRWAEAREEMQAALACLPAERSEVRAEILIEMAKASNWGFSDAAGIRRYADEALGLAEGVGREDLAIGALSTLVMADMADGLLHAGIVRHQRAAARAGGRHARGLAVGAQFAALAHYWLADFAPAIECAREAIALGRAAYDSSTVTRAQGDLGCALTGSGRYAEALQVFAEGRRESREQGTGDWLARLVLMHGGLHLEVFDFTGAETLAQEAREISRSAQHVPMPMVSSGLDLLLNFARRGDLGRAEGLVDEVAAGVVNIRGAHGWLWTMRLAQARAEIALGRGNCEEVLQHAEEAIARSRTMGRIKYEVAGLQVRGQALAAQGHTREALGHLQAAVARARGTGDPAMFLRAAAALLALDGDDDLLTEARATVERIAGALPDPALRRCFLAADPVRMVMGPKG
jgi:transcriptional regulator with XRE-family HTH domain/tetratricopeptide (TPR) repeat protein